MIKESNIYFSSKKIDSINKGTIECTHCNGYGRIKIKEKTREEIDQVLSTDLCACGLCMTCQARRYEQ